MGYTYLAYDFYDEDEFGSDEPHVLKWGTFEDLKKGSFGEWNALVGVSLDNMGIKYKK